MTSKILTLSILASSALLTTPTFAEEITLDPIVVSSDFREKKLSQTSNAVTVIGEEELYDKSSQSFEDVIGQTPNVNFTSGGSRAHHIQIRGIGERSQFQYPINPSVGLYIDGMDFSNSALAVTLFDVKQIEVLKGPQGTIFGANGMAGVINVQSNEPTEALEGHIEATVGNYNTKSLGLAVGGTLVKDTLEGRISVFKNKNDGFMKNNFVNRKNTQNIDELTAKAQLRWYVSDQHTIDLNFMHLNIDNGYDAFTLDNSRTSYSDEPGNDSLKTNAFAIKSNYQINNEMHLLSQLDWSSSDSDYSYDNDWSYNGQIVDGALQYIGSDSYKRNRKNLAFDVKLVSDEDGKIFNHTTSWTFGGYYQNQKYTLDRFTRYEQVGYKESTTLATNYETKSVAVYGQLDTEINSKLTLITGIRIEDWRASYRDNQLVIADFSPDTYTNVNIKYDEVLYGGKLGLNYQYDRDVLLYTSLSRGYKPGGVNIDATLTPVQKTYETEILWNIEAGMNSTHLDNSLMSRLNFFYAKRKDQQIGSSIQNGANFTEYLANAASGYNYGIESELDYYPNESLHVYSRIGLLKTKFDEYNNPDPTSHNVTGRAQAQSPTYQYNVGFDVTFGDGWIFKTNIEGKGSYYFSDAHDQKSKPYTLAHSSLEYTNGSWSTVLWVRNITNKDYAVKGYYFDNKIADGNGDGNSWNEPELYTQKGAPRTFGLTVAYDF